MSVNLSRFGSFGWGEFQSYFTLMLALWLKPELLVNSDVYVLCASVLVM